MVDPTTGAVHFEQPRAVIAPSLTRTQFLQGPLAQGAAAFVVNEPWHSWKLGRLHEAGLSFVVILGFHAQCLKSVTLHQSAALTGSWEDWSVAQEQQRKQAHERWLDQCLGARRDFPWGTVSSGYDARSGSSDICIRYTDHSAASARTG